MQSINFNSGFSDYLTKVVKKTSQEKVVKLAQDAMSTHVLLSSPPSPLASAPSTLPETMAQIPMPIIETSLTDREIQVLQTAYSFIPFSLTQRILANMSLGNIASVLFIAGAIACVAYFLFRGNYTKPEEKPPEIKKSEEVKMGVDSSSQEIVKPLIEEEKNQSIYTDETHILKVGAVFIASLVAIGFLGRKNSHVDQLYQNRDLSLGMSETKDGSASPPPRKQEGCIALQNGVADFSNIPENCLLDDKIAIAQSRVRDSISKIETLLYRQKMKHI